MNEYAGREKDIEAREKAATNGPDLQKIKARADFAIKNYSRLGSSWAEFYGRDIPYLLAQLREAREKLAGVKELPLRHDKLPHATGGGCRSRCLACQRDRILKGGD